MTNPQWIADDRCPPDHTYYVPNHNDPSLIPMSESDSLFRGAAGRRTFVRETDEGRIIIYSRLVGGVLQQQFCTRDEWDEWCEKFAPPVARVGMDYPGKTRCLAVTGKLESGMLECLVTEKRILSQEQADRMLLRILAEGASGPAPAEDAPPETPDDDGA